MSWRLILDGARSGPDNMARDEVCLAAARESGLATLRLYGWEGPVLSVGRNQRLGGEINLAACRAEGIPLVRRMTGGRGVLHGSDLTYAVAAPTRGGRFAPGIMEVYREISQVFVRFFQQLGHEPEVKAYSGGQRARMASPVCFATPSAFEILIAGKKVVGSAQRLHPGGFLQHGSIPLHPQHALLARIFNGADEKEIQANMTDLETMGVWDRFTEEEVRRRLAGAFADMLGIGGLEPMPWREEEEAQVAALMPAYAYLEPQPVPRAAPPP